MIEKREDRTLGQEILKAVEPKPLFIRASDISRLVVGLSPSTAANWRSEGKGPDYYKVGGSVYYKVDDLEKFFGAKKILSHN